MINDALTSRQGTRSLLPRMPGGYRSSAHAAIRIRWVRDPGSVDLRQLADRVDPLDGAGYQDASGTTQHGACSALMRVQKAFASARFEKAPVRRRHSDRPSISAMTTAGARPLISFGSFLCRRRQSVSAAVSELAAVSWTAKWCCVAVGSNATGGRFCRSVFAATVADGGSAARVGGWLAAIGARPGVACARCVSTGAGCLGDRSAQMSPGSSTSGATVTG